VRGYEAELRDLRERIVELRVECEMEVEKRRRRRELEWAFERGDVAVVVGESSSSGGVLEAAKSIAWTRRRPEDRIPEMKCRTSKEAGCGAEGLATPNAQGMCCDSLPGPSWALANAQGRQFPRIEKRAEEGRTAHNPQPLRRQPAQMMMVIPTDTSSPHGMDTY
jgi:hypothetical protein